MKNLWFGITIFIFFYPAGVWGQTDNTAFYDKYTIAAADSGSLKFGLEAFGYVRNNEFRDDPVPGYTLFGYQFRPYFLYFPSSRLRLEAGGFFRKDFGEDGFSEIRPVLSIKYSTGNFSMIFGSIEGAMSHRLIEPLYNFENLIDHRIEDGLQVKYESGRIFFDTWIEWINMIDFGDDALEEFNFGLSFHYRLIETPVFRMDLPLQLLANHHGGEIDVSPEPANTLVDAAAGLGIEFPFPNESFLEKVRFEGYYGIYESSDDPGYLPYLEGDGWYFNLSGTSGDFEFMVSYWWGDKFYAPYGGPLYQSEFVSGENNVEFQQHRELLFLRMNFEHHLSKDLVLAIRFEPVYDIANDHFDHTEGLYLRYRTDFLLKRKQKP